MPPTVKTSAPIAAPIRQAVLRDYGMEHVADEEYELDYLITPELGGSSDRRNLWPERWGTPAHPLTHLGPFPAHLVGANAKDKTENALHTEVCHGTLTLRAAQFIIATDWFKYYRDKVLK